MEAQSGFQGAGADHGEADLELAKREAHMNGYRSNAKSKERETRIRTSKFAVKRRLSTALTSIKRLQVRSVAEINRKIRHSQLGLPVQGIDELTGSSQLRKTIGIRPTELSTS